MTDLADPPSDRKGERDAPAIADMPPSWRLLRALSGLKRKLAARFGTARRNRSLRFYRMNEHMLRDIGLARVEDEERGPERAHPLMLPLQRRDEQ